MVPLSKYIFAIEGVLSSGLVATDTWLSMVVASPKKAWASETFCCFSASELTVPVSMITRSSPFASRSFPSSECRVSTLLTQVRLLASPLLENVPAKAEKLNA